MDAPTILAVLRCPTCRSEVTARADHVACDGCAATYPGVLGGTPTLDLRPRAPFTVELAVTVGTDGPADRAAPPPLSANPASIAAFRGQPTSGHTTATLISWVPAPSRPGALALDLGCGAGDSRAAVEATGYTYVGVDYGHEAAMLLADGHALPFADATFDFVISLAVLEHLHTPSLAMSEVRRLLVPGRQVLGTVAFLEPFHQRSYFHHTSLGVAQALGGGGLAVDHLWSAGPSWTLFDAQAKVLYKGSPDRLKRAFAWSSGWLHRAWWALGRRSGRAGFSRDEQYATTAGSWAFLATAPADAPTDLPPHPEPRSEEAAPPPTGDPHGLAGGI